MKNIFSLLLCISLSFGLVGCADEPNNLVVSGGDAYNTPVIDEDVVAVDDYQFVYADGLYAEELADRIADRVFFDFDKSSLNARAIETLNAQIGWLKANPDKSIILEGHCDERGTREYNLGLGERRANAVKTYMIANGINPNRLKTLSYGKERPAILGNNNAAWAQNRRTVTIICD